MTGLPFDDAGEGLVRRCLDGLLHGGLLTPGSRVLAAVSGGGDSTAMLVLLRAAAPVLGLSLEVAVIDHRTRPGTVAECREVVARADAMGLACHVVALQEAIGRAGEGVLREARRSALCELAAMRGASWIALGHQRDDLVETMVMRLLRDAGVDGLGGIPAVSPPFVRPLSGRTRAELRALLRVLGVSWFEDPTNDDASRLRARVRHRVLPVLRRFDPGIDDRFVRLAGSMRALGTGLRRAEDEWVSRHAERWGGGVRVSRAVFAARPPVEVGRWVRCLAEAAGVPARRMGRACIEEVRRVIVAGRGEVPLPCGRTASCDEAWVLIGPRFHDSARLRLVGPGGTC